MKNKELDNILDQVTAGIRAEQVDEAVVSDATERVWAQLSTENSAPARMEAAPADRIEGCADFQTLIPAYLDGKLVIVTSMRERKRLMDDRAEAGQILKRLKLRPQNIAEPQIPASSLCFVNRPAASC
jgi:hypothetical protein